MAKRVVILTGSELRHEYFRKALAEQDEIEVLRTYCEGLEKSLRTVVEKDEGDTIERTKHLHAREESEQIFFGDFVVKTPDHSNPVFLPKGEINLPQPVEEIIALQPDVIVAYGCSLIKDPLINAFPRQFLNVHLGLSPYYRGSGTNYWPLVNGEPEYVGATFMYIDVGVDTGEVIHQIRARVEKGDTPSSIGNRLIRDMVPVYASIIRKLDSLPSVPQIPAPSDDKYYKKKDYTEESVKILYSLFEKGLIEKYLAEMHERTARVPIVENPALV